MLTGASQVRYQEALAHTVTGEGPDGPDQAVSACYIVASEASAAPQPCN